MDVTTLPFPVGSTLYDGRTIDTANLAGTEFEGREYERQDVNPTSGTPRTNRTVRLRVVRNSGPAGVGAFLAKYAVTFEVTAGGNLGQRADGLATTEAQRVAGFVDEYLPAAGCPINDLCYIVIQGPALARTSLAGNAENSIAVGDRLVAATAATSGATTAGRLKPIDMTGATQNLANQIQHTVGRAMSARTTANTNVDLLVDTNIKW